MGNFWTCLVASVFSACLTCRFKHIFRSITNISDQTTLYKCAVVNLLQLLILNDKGAVTTQYVTLYGIINTHSLFRYYKIVLYRSVELSFNMRKITNFFLYRVVKKIKFETDNFKAWFKNMVLETKVQKFKSFRNFYVACRIFDNPVSFIVCKNWFRMSFFLLIRNDW